MSLQWLEGIDVDILKKVFYFAIGSVFIGILFGFLINFFRTVPPATSFAAAPAFLGFLEYFFGFEVPFWLRVFFVNLFMVVLTLFTGYAVSKFYLKISSDYGSRFKDLRFDWKVADYFRGLKSFSPRSKDAVSLLVLAPLLFLIFPFLRTGVYFFNLGFFSFLIFPILIFEGFLAIYACAVAVNLGIKISKKDLEFESITLTDKYLSKFLLIMFFLLVSAFLEHSFKVVVL